ncbi:hypothetical protein H8959_013359 [Pygathrix nigripes]
MGLLGQRGSMNGFIALGTYFSDCALGGSERWHRPPRGQECGGTAPITTPLPPPKRRGPREGLRLESVFLVLSRSLDVVSVYAGQKRFQDPRPSCPRTRIPPASAHSESDTRGPLSGSPRNPRPCGPSRRRARSLLFGRGARLRRARSRGFSLWATGSSAGSGGRGRGPVEGPGPGASPLPQQALDQNPARGRRRGRARKGRSRESGAGQTQEGKEREEARRTGRGGARAGRAGARAGGCARRGLWVAAARGRRRAAARECVRRERAEGLQGSRRRPWQRAGGGRSGPGLGFSLPGPQRAGRSGPRRWRRHFPAPARGLLWALAEDQRTGGANLTEGRGRRLFPGAPDRAGPGGPLGAVPGRGTAAETRSRS